MRKFFALLLLVAGSFGGGYYLGQRPVGSLQDTVSDLSKRLAASEKLVSDVRQSLKHFSQNALDTTLGIKRDLRLRQGLVEAQTQLALAKADIADRNFGNAERKLASAIAALEASTKNNEQDSETDAVLDLAGSLREVRLEVAMGKSASLKRIDDVQRRMDQLLKNK